MNDFDSTQKRYKSKGLTIALVGLACVLMVAAATRPRGADAVQIVEQRFPDVDAAALLEGYIGEPLTEHDLTVTAAYRAMCMRTLSHVASASEKGAEARPAGTQLDELANPGVVLRNFDNAASAAVFDAVIDSMSDGDLGVAADFVTNQCDAERVYLSQRSLDSIAHLVDKDSASELASRVTSQDPLPVGPEGEPAEPDE